MTSVKPTWQTALLNTALAAAGIVAIVLLYALVARFSTPRIDPARGSNPTSLVGDILQVEVLNGCGVSNLAADTRNYLRQQGFDVVSVGDYQHFEVDKSTVIDRVGDRDAASKLAVALGIPEDRIQEDIRPDLYLDASIIVGSDYETLKPFRKKKNAL